jgi:phosphate acetyltransferase
MDVISRIRNRAKKSLKLIVLPEYEDSRTLEAARIIQSEGLARVEVLTPDKVNKGEKEKYIQQYYQMHSAKDVDLDSVKELFDRDTLYYSAMKTREGKFDGIVAGASHTTPDMVRSAMRCLGIDEKITVISSSFIMDVPDCVYGEAGAFIFADCGVIPEPNSRQLACIALSAAGLAHKVLDLIPRIAFLSYSTKGSARTKSADKISEALSLLKEMDPDLLADGELQVDAAIVPEVAQIKYPDSPIKGRANILIFPNLEAGNIGYKLSQRLSGARAVGPLLMGLNKPASDLSRGCSVDDIVDCVAVTAIRAQ